MREKADYIKGDKSNECNIFEQMAQTEVDVHRAWISGNHSWVKLNKGTKTAIGFCLNLRRISFCAKIGVPFSYRFNCHDFWKT